MPSGFIHAGACVRTAFLSGLTTLIVWMDHGLLVRSSVVGRMEGLHSSLRSYNICGITSESSMTQKSLTINYFINFFYFEKHQTSEEGKNACEFRLCLGTNALVS